MVRFGIVGASGIAKKFARDLDYVENALITAVSARTKEQALEYQSFYNTKYAFSSYEEMAKSDVIDAVYISTPHSFHLEHAIMFMKNKKHVLVEKPMAVNLKQLEEMIKVAKENNVLLMEAMWTHFLPSTRFVKNIIEKENLGKLIEARVEFGYELITNYPEERRLLNPALAGGSILDMGVYPISFYNIFKQANTKSLSAKAVFTETGVDSDCEIEIIDDNDAKITLISSIKKAYDNNAILKFENGIIKVIDFSRSKEVYLNETRFDIEFEGEGFVHEIRSFTENIENGELENQIMTHKASQDAMKIMEEVRKLIGLKYPFE